MKKYLKYFIGLAIFVSFTFSNIGLMAQERISPGGKQKVPLGCEVRNGKLVFKSETEDFAWWIDSRIQIDAAMYFERKNRMSNGATLRRLTLSLKSILWKNWDAEVDIDFAEAVSTKSQIELRDMWIRYIFPNFNLSFQVGNFKEPFGMERLNSSRLLTFLERTAISNAIPLGRRIGAAVKFWTDYAQITGAIMGHEPGTRIDKGQEDEGFSTNIRLSAAPVNTYGHNLHLGLAGSYKIPDVVADLKLNTIEINARTETFVFNPKFLHTGDIADVNYYNRYGAELMYINGPFYFQSEFLGASIIRWYKKPTINLKGGYAIASWMITGETRYYFVDQGEIGPVEPPKNTWGALELAARFSVTNLNDLNTEIRGGQSNQLMLGLNYYPNMSIKIQFNYSYVNLDQYATRKGNLIGNDDHSFIQMRFQASL